MQIRIFVLKKIEVGRVVQILLILSDVQSPNPPKANNTSNWFKMSLKSFI